MSLIVNGTNVMDANYNGTKLSEVIIDGTKVFPGYVWNKYNTVSTPVYSTRYYTNRSGITGVTTSYESYFENPFISVSVSSGTISNTVFSGSYRNPSTGASVSFSATTELTIPVALNVVTISFDDNATTAAGTIIRKTERRIVSASVKFKRYQSTTTGTTFSIAITVGTQTLGTLVQKTEDNTTYYATVPNTTLNNNTGGMKSTASSVYSVLPALYVTTNSFSSISIATYYKATVASKQVQTGTNYSQGTYIGQVFGTTSTAYPANGRHTDGYWYVKAF